MHTGYVSWPRRARRARRMGTAVLVLAVAAVLPPATPRPAAAEGLFVFQGGGYGHSVGMSQFGAYGMALDGYGWDQILTHYYTGTTIADADPAVSSDPLWVNILQDQTRMQLTTVAVGPDPVEVVYTQDGRELRAFPEQTATIERLSDGRCRITTPRGSLTGSCSINGEWDGWSPSPSTGFVLQGCTHPNWNLPGGTVYQPCTYARGGVRIRPDDDTNTVHLSVEIAVEDYVLGISESPYFWGSSGGMAALQAQAVAARSYALRKAYDRGRPEDRPWCACELYDTTVDQFYVGWGHATSEWFEAVNSTAGKVVIHPSTVLDGVQRPIEAFYSSSTFGWTENSEHGFSTYVPYLRGVDDHWSLLPEVDNHSARWTVEFTGSELAARLPGLATVTGVSVSACSPSGAALELTFHGSGGPKAFRTSHLRSLLGVKSMQIFNVGSPPPETPPCPGPGTDPVTEGGPVALSAVFIDDDSAGDSIGDGDGIAEAGELIEVFVELENIGDALSGITAVMSSDDPALTVVWNESSAYPPIGAGRRAVNDADWDLSIAPGASGTATTLLRVSASNGGPWTVEVPITIGAPQEQPSVNDRDPVGIVDLPDIGGTSSPDVAVAFTRPARASRVRVIDPESGATLMETPVGPSDRTLADLAVVPSFGGSPAPEIAVLLVADGEPAMVRMYDAATGEHVGMRRFGNAAGSITWTSLAPVAGAGPNGGDAVALLGRRADGFHRVVVKAIAHRRRISITGLGTGFEVFDFGVHGDVGGDGVPELAILGRRADGVNAVRRIDPATGDELAPLHVPLNRNPVLAVAAGSTEAPRLLVVSTLPNDGRVHVASIDAVARITEGGMILPLKSPVAAVPVPEAGSGAPVAVMGLLGDGTVASVVADPVGGIILSAPEYTSGSPIDLTAVPGIDRSEPRLAGLVSAPGAPSIEVRAALSGARVTSIPLD